VPGTPSSVHAQQGAVPGTPSSVHAQQGAVPGALLCVPGAGGPGAPVGYA